MFEACVALGLTRGTRQGTLLYVLSKCSSSLFIIVPLLAVRRAH